MEWPCLVFCGFAFVEIINSAIFGNLTRGSYVATTLTTNLLGGTSLAYRPLLGILLGIAIATGAKGPVILCLFLAHLLWSFLDLSQSGRGTFVFPLVAALATWTLFQRSLKRIFWVVLSLGLLLIFFSTVMGNFRDLNPFHTASLDDKFSLMRSAAAETEISVLPSERFLQRLYEKCGIDLMTVHKENAMPAKLFQGFTGLWTLYFPAALVPRKESVFANYQVLIDYGVIQESFGTNTAPVTLIADTYTRFGFWGVFITYFLLGWLYAKIAFRLWNHRWPFIPIFVYPTFGYLLFTYTSFLLGIIRTWTYYLPKNLIFWALLFVLTGNVTMNDITQKGKSNKRQ